MGSNYAYKYNDVFDDYFIQREPSGNAAPKKNPTHNPYQQEREKRQQPSVYKQKKTKAQVIKENKRKFKIALAKVSVITACFVAMFMMAVSSGNQLEKTVAELNAVNESYELCLQENNKLKQQLDEVLKKVDIDKIAQEQLGLIKVPEKNQREINISLYQ